MEEVKSYPDEFDLGALWFALTEENWVGISDLADNAIRETEEARNDGDVMREVAWAGLVAIAEHCFSEVVLNADAGSDHSVNLAFLR